MNDIVTETAFLNEVSAFLASSDISGTVIGQVDANQSVHPREAGTSDTEIQNSAEVRDTPAIKQASKHLTRRQKEVLRKKRYEQRLKKERETLRAMESELTTQLTQLKQGRSTKQLHSGNPVATNSAWRALTLLRREEKHRAEMEQLRLETAIDEQATYLATLRSLVPKYLYDWVAITETIRIAIVSSRQMNMQANHALFAEHLRQIFAAYTQVDEVFSDLLTLPDGMTASVSKPNVDGTVRTYSRYLNHFNKFTLPFNFEQSHKAWWNITNLNQWIQDGDGYANLADPSDTFILRTRLVRALPTGMTVSFIQRYILRRFVEESQAVFLWKTYSEGEGPFTGIQLEETGWARLQPTTEDSTMVTVCVRQAPMQLDASKPRPTDGQQFIYDMMQDLLEENAKIIMSLLSKKLIEDTLAPIDV